jgi:hypothetical protein
MMPEVGSEDVCPSCVRAGGLCDRHHVGVLPLLARNIGWLKLMGEARTEQTKRQRKAKELPISAEGRAHALRVLSAKKHARSKRRGMHGLMLAIMERKVG